MNNRISQYLAPDQTETRRVPMGFAACQVGMSPAAAAIHQMAQEKARRDVQKAKQEREFYTFLNKTRFTLEN